MYFLSKKNADILFDVISEESINVDYPSFNQIFIEYGQTTGNNLPLMEMNKQFIRYLLANYGRKNTSQQQQQNNISTSMPSRPQGSRSKNVSFDQQLELHRQHFQQYSAPPPPEPPVFKDETPSPSGDLDILMKKALTQRRFDRYRQVCKTSIAIAIDIARIINSWFFLKVEDCKARGRVH